MAVAGMYIVALRRRQAKLRRQIHAAQPQPPVDGAIHFQNPIFVPHSQQSDGSPQHAGLKAWDTPTVLTGSSKLTSTPPTAGIGAWVATAEGLKPSSTQATQKLPRVSAAEGEAHNYVELPDPPHKYVELLGKENLFGRERPYEAPYEAVEDANIGTYAELSGNHEVYGFPPKSAAEDEYTELTGDHQVYYTSPAHGDSETGNRGAARPSTGPSYEYDSYYEYDSRMSRA